jgi:hypothetical protein
VLHTIPSSQCWPLLAACSGHMYDHTLEVMTPPRLAHCGSVSRERLELQPMLCIGAMCNSVGCRWGAARARTLHLAVQILARSCCLGAPLQQLLDGCSVLLGGPLCSRMIVTRTAMLQLYPEWPVTQLTSARKIDMHAQMHTCPIVPMHTRKAERPACEATQTYQCIAAMFAQLLAGCSSSILCGLQIHARIFCILNYQQG